MYSFSEQFFLADLHQRKTKITKTRILEWYQHVVVITTDKRIWLPILLLRPTITCLPFSTLMFKCESCSGVAFISWIFWLPVSIIISWDIFTSWNQRNLLKSTSRTKQKISAKCKPGVQAQSELVPKSPSVCHWVNTWIKPHTSCTYYTLHKQLCERSGSPKGTDGSDLKGAGILSKRDAVVIGQPPSSSMTVRTPPT